MNIVVFMIPTALFLSACFLFAFIWAVSQGQYDDVETPSYRILIDDNQRERNHDEPTIR